VPDPRIFAPAATAPARLERSGHLNLVYHGTMAERLGVDLVIRAVARLQDRVPCARLHLWGHGDDLPQFQRLAQELNVQDRVFFEPKGFPLQELPGRLASMDVGVIGNRLNPACDLMLPVKLLEYVALGIPAVVPRLRTIEHYFTDDMVAYYEPENVESLADSIQRLWSQPKARERQAARARDFLERYGWERQGGELISFYQTLVEH
jgi:glycosyltransferase involved in cell wall biosynthesis